VRAEVFIRTSGGAGRRWNEPDVFHVPLLHDQLRSRIYFIRITPSRAHVLVSDTAQQYRDHL